ncbi:MAG: solute carrier family 23 protein, partial [bacterium]
SNAVVALPPDISTTAFKLDVMGVFARWEWIALVFVLLFFDLFDTVGTLIGVSEKAGLIKDGKLPRATRALSADAFGTIAGAFLGTSTTTSYVESTAGVTAGARTGFASLVTALLFEVAIFFHPLVSLLAVDMVTAPALILVGALMMTSVVKINWTDFYEAAPAFLVIILMPLTYSISKGLVAGFISWPLLQIAAGRARKVHPFLYGVASVLVVAVTASYLVLEPPKTIHEHVAQGDTAAVEKLLAKNPELARERNASSQTPLHPAAETGNIEIVKMMIENGSPLNAKDDRCSTPLHKAAAAGELETVKLLIKKGARRDVLDREGRTPLELARENGHARTAKFLAKISGTEL